jgi:hypothetical protein
MTSLISLQISHTGIGGAIPNSIGGLHKLEIIELSHNQITGKLPDAMLQMNTLQQLDVSKNAISGGLLDNFGENLPDLVALNLMDNELTGAVPNSIFKSTKMHTLQLSGNLFSGIDLHLIRELATCKRLWLGGINTIAGPIPIELLQLPALEELDLSYSNLEGSIALLTHLSNLTAVYMNGNQLSGALPANITELTMLRHLWFGHNRLEGGIPSLAVLINLESLRLDHNRFNYIKFEDLNPLSRLRVLRINHNQLQNEIGSRFLLQAPLVIDLSWNKLHGGVPMQILQTDGLGFFKLDGNTNISHRTRVHVHHVSERQTLCWTNDAVDNALPDKWNLGQIVPEDDAADSTSSSLVELFWGNVRHIACSNASGWQLDASCLECNTRSQPPRVQGDNFTVSYNGNLYKTLYPVQAENQSVSGCQIFSRQLPPGWSLAPDNEESRMVVASFPWGTRCLILGSGRSYNSKAPLHHNTIPVDKLASGGDIGIFEVTNTPIADTKSNLSGTFATWAQTKRIQFVAADFNGDGKTDVALVGGSKSIPVAFSQGDGEFNVTNYEVKWFAHYAQLAKVKAVAGDFNGDGKGDIALIGGKGLATMPVAFGDGDGQFTHVNKQIIGFATRAQTKGVQFVAADFNGDGKTDVALVHVGGSDWVSIHVAFSQGNGEFSVTNSKVKWFAQSAKATWLAQAVAGDFNGDGKGDIALIGGKGWVTVPVAFGDGDGHFSHTNKYSTHFVRSSTLKGAKFVAADFNGDGKTDVALVGGTDRVSIPVAFSQGNGNFSITDLKNDGARQFTQYAQLAKAKAVAGDFDGDGKGDIALTRSSDGQDTIPVAFSKVKDLPRHYCPVFPSHIRANGGMCGPGSSCDEGVPTSANIYSTNLRPIQYKVEQCARHFLIYQVQNTTSTGSMLSFKGIWSGSIRCGKDNITMQIDASQSPQKSPVVQISGFKESCCTAKYTGILWYDSDTRSFSIQHQEWQSNQCGYSAFVIRGQPVNGNSRFNGEIEPTAGMPQCDAFELHNLWTDFQTKEEGDDFTWPTVGPILDQGHCGACYAFASAGVLADRLNSKVPGALEGYIDGQLTNTTVSPQWIMERLMAYMPYRRHSNWADMAYFAHQNNYGLCSGGYPYSAFVFLSQNGAATCDAKNCSKGCYPYIGKMSSAGVSSCQSGHGNHGGGSTYTMPTGCQAGHGNIANGGSWTSATGRHNNWRQKYCPSGFCFGEPGTAMSCVRAAKPDCVTVGFWDESAEIRIRNELKMNGPVAATMILHDDFLSTFGNEYSERVDQGTAQHDDSSVYTGKDCTNTSGSHGMHAVKIVGWGIHNNLKYWKVANSWGTKWNGNGYFKIQRGINLCRIEQNVCFVSPSLSKQEEDGEVDKTRRAVTSASLGIADAEDPYAERQKQVDIQTGHINMGANSVPGGWMPQDDLSKDHIQAAHLAAIKQHQMRRAAYLSQDPAEYHLISAESRVVKGVLINLVTKTKGKASSSYKLMSLVYKDPNSKYTVLRSRVEVDELELDRYESVANTTATGIPKTITQRVTMQIAPSAYSADMQMVCETGYGMALHLYLDKWKRGCWVTSSSSVITSQHRGVPLTHVTFVAVVPHEDASEALAAAHKLKGSGTLVSSIRSAKMVLGKQAVQVPMISTIDEPHLFSNIFYPATEEKNGENRELWLLSGIGIGSFSMVLLGTLALGAWLRCANVRKKETTGALNKASCIELHSNPHSRERSSSEKAIDVASSANLERESQHDMDSPALDSSAPRGVIKP